MADFIRAIREDSETELDVYGAADTAAPAILAAESVERGGIPIKVPSFRPGGRRKKGEKP
jgi:hypothetical protein